MFSVAVGRKHCACRDEQREGGGGGYGRRKEGRVRCSEVGTELKSKESSVTRLLGGPLDMLLNGVLLFLVNLISNQLARFPRNVSMEHDGSCQAALIFLKFMNHSGSGKPTPNLVTNKPEKVLNVLSIQRLVTRPISSPLG